MQLKSHPAFAWSVRLALGFVVLWFLLSHRENFAASWRAARGVSWQVFPLAIGFYWLGQLLCVWKWQLLLRARGFAPSFGVCTRVYSVGMFGNLWLPTNVGGDALRAILLQKHTPRIGWHEAASSIFVERFTGFVALLFLGACGIWAGGAARGAFQILMGGAALLIFLAVSLALMIRLPGAKFSRARENLAFYFLPQNRGVLALCLALSLVFQLSQVALNWGLARAIDLNVPAALFVWVGPALSLSGLLPVGVGGLGVREAGAVTLLGDFAPQGKIIAWSLLWQATVWGASLPGGLFLRMKPPKPRE